MQCQLKVLCSLQWCETSKLQGTQLGWRLQLALVVLLYCEKTLKSSDALLIMGSEKLSLGCLTCAHTAINTLLPLLSLAADVHTHTLVYTHSQPYSVQEHLCWEFLLCCGWEREPGFSPSAKTSWTSTFTWRWLQHMQRSLRVVFCFLTFHTFSSLYDMFIGLEGRGGITEETKALHSALTQLLYTSASFRGRLHSAWWLGSVSNWNH